MPEHRYIKFGEGKEVLLCFHGYEQDATLFNLLDKSWREKYTIYAFDLLHHGESTFPVKRIPKQPFLPNEFKTYFDSFLKENSINKFQIMGYSLGSRVSLYLAHLFPEKVAGLYLFAPDGFKKMPLQHFIEHNRLGIFLFRYFVNTPSFVHISVKGLKKIKVIRKRLHDFVLRKTQSLKQRKQLYVSWQTYKKLHLSKKQIEHLLNNNKNVHLLFGEFDAVIPLSNLALYSFKEDNLVILPKGHDLFDEASIKALQLRLKF